MMSNLNTDALIQYDMSNPCFECKILLLVDNLKEIARQNLDGGELYVRESSNEQL